MHAAIASFCLATTATLAHSTTWTNQQTDVSTVEIGFHFAATDSNGNLLDADGDGIPDIIEDFSGNGAFDSGLGETDWLNYTSQNSLVVGSGLQVFTPLKP